MQVYFECHGCSMNYGEGRIMKELVEENFSIVNDFNNADVIILSTCIVIEKTEREMLKRVKFFTEKNKEIIVSGCMASAQKEKIFAINKNAKLLKPREIYKINYILKNLEKEISDDSFKRVLEKQNLQNLEKEIFLYKKINKNEGEKLKEEIKDKKLQFPIEKQIKTEFVKQLQEKKLSEIEKSIKTGLQKEIEEQISEKKNQNSISISEKSIDAIIPIAQGCLGKCSYCITKIARGKLKSYEMQEILKNVEKSLKKGYKEIRLTAQDAACYGKDIKTSLPNLISEVAKLNENFRIRVGMMNPNNALKILNELIKSYKNQKVFKFLHLPVQSGDNEILKLMGREYSVNDFKKIAKKFRSEFDDLTLSTDIIVGFPSETDNQFENTLNLMKEIKPDIINIKGFSPREGTKAFKMKQLHSRVIRERTRVLSSLRFELSKENFEKLISKKENVLVVEKGKNETFVARTNSYRTVILKEKIELGKFYNVKIEDAKDFYLIGKLV